MAHYILADDFDFDSIIIKSFDFDLEKSILSLTFTYNDGHELTASVDFLESFATIDYVDNKIVKSLEPYSTTEEVGTMIATALNDYDTAQEVTNKIDEAIAKALLDYYTIEETNNEIANQIATALNNYYTRTEVDSKDNTLKENYIQRDKDVTNNLMTEIGKKAITGVKNDYSTDTNAITTTVYQADGTQQVGIATIPNGTNSDSGLISAAQTKKLNNIADGANKYVLPEATVDELGGVKAADKDDAYTVECKKGTDGKLYVTPGQYELQIATSTTLGGVKPTATKTSAYTVPVAVDAEGGLFTIPGNYELKVATTDALGGVKIGYTENAKNYAVKVDENGKAYVTVNWSDTTYNVATTSVNGLMASTDKSKLDGIAANANNYSLPTMTASVKGGAKAGSGLEMNGEALNVKTDGVTTGIQGNAVEVLTDGETIQAGTNGLEVKVDNSTIKIGDNGLYANVETAPAIFPNLDDVLYDGKGTSSTEAGMSFDVNVVVYSFYQNGNVTYSYQVKINDVIVAATGNSTMIFVKKGSTVKLGSSLSYKIFSLQS